MKLLHASSYLRVKSNLASLMLYFSYLAIHNNTFELSSYRTACKWLVGLTMLALLDCIFSVNLLYVLVVEIIV